MTFVEHELGANHNTNWCPPCDSANQRLWYSAV